VPRELKGGPSTSAPARISIGDLATVIGRLIGRPLEPEVETCRIRPPASEVERLCADAGRAAEMLGWRAEVDVERGLEATIAWIGDNLDRYHQTAMSSEPDHRRIPLSVPCLEGNERAYLAECIETNWVSSAGPFVGRFETADAETWQVDPAIVVRYLTEGCEQRGGAVHDRSTGRRVAAVLPAHILGHPVDMDPILAAARRHGVPVVEDAAEALGATYKGRAVGTLGDIGCFSFNGNKLVTSGGGGMVVTGEAAIADRVRHLTTQAKSDPVEHVHDAVGYNYRLTNVQAAVGCAQMDRLADLVEARRRIAGHYRAVFADVAGISFMPEASWARSTFWLSTVRVEAETAGIDRHGLAAVLDAAGIETRPLWQPLHHSPAHAGARALGGIVSDRLNHEALSLPSSASLTEADQGRVIDAVLTAVQ